MKRAPSLLLGALMALGLLVGVPGPASAAPIQIRGNLVLSETHLQRGDVITLRGWVPPRSARTVIAQRKMSWGWSSVNRGKSGPRGRFELTWTADAAPGPVVLRVLAPRRTIKGRLYKMIKTPSRRMVIDPEPQGVPGDIHPVTMGNNVSDRISLSEDGRWAVFDSLARDLVDSDTNDYQDVFLHDRETGTTIAVTNGRGTSYASDISADGRYVLFDSYASSLVPGDTNQSRDVFVFDRDTDSIERLTDGNNGSYAGGMSDDGRWVVLYSFATNLVPDDTNGYRDAFLFDRDTDTLTRLTAGNGAALTPSISGDGLWVSFYSGASNLVPNDRNKVRDVFLYDVATATTTRLTNGNAASYAASKALSGDGRYLTFWSDASNLLPGDTNGRSDVFVYDRLTATTTRLTAGDNHSSLPAISGDGQHIAFQSYATDIAVGSDHNDQPDIFVWDAVTGLVSRLTDGNGPSSNASVSADGTAIGLTSAGSNLAPGDTNKLADVFVWQRLTTG